MAGLSRLGRLNPWLRGYGVASDLYDLFRAYPGGAPDDYYTFPGYSFIRMCYPGTETLFSETNSDYGCVTGQVISSGMKPIGTPITSPSDYLYTYNVYTTSSGLTRGRVVRKHAYNGEPMGEPYKKPGRAPGWLMPSRPAVNPGIDPDSLPIGQPVTQPDPIPWDLVPHLRNNPWRVHQSQRGNHAPGDAVRPEPDPPTLEWGPSGPPNVKPPNHVRKPPRSGEKERKVVPKVLGAAYWVADKATEAVDVIDALYDALPDECKLPYTPGDPILPQDKAAQVYKCFDKLNLGLALSNLAYNQIEDWAYGRTQGALSEVRQRSGIHAYLPEVQFLL